MEELHRQWAANIRMGRRALGLTQKQLADALNVQQQTVGKWEAPVTAPRDEMKIRIATVLHQDVRQLFPLYRVLA